MKYLENFGFTNTDIDNIVENNYQYIIENLELNKNNIMEIINYLLEIGLEKTTIKDIFIYQVSFFFKNLDEIKKSFDEYEMDSVVKSLNYDVNNIELIDFI